MKRILHLAQGIALAGLLAAAAPAAYAASGNWNVNAAGNWSGTANWTPAAVPGTAAGDVVGLTFNITAARTVTIDTTSRTVGTLNIGDPTTGFFVYTLAASGGATLTFNNSGSPANLMQAATTAADVISAPLVLADDLSVNNTSSGGLTLSGVISGVGRSITKNGGGLFVLGNGANTYTGKTILYAGTTRITGTTSLGPVPAAYTADQLTLDGGLLMNNNSDVILAANQGLTLGGSGGRFQAGWSRPLTVNSIITGPGGLTLASDATPGLISLNAANTYTGPTVVGNNAANSWAWLLVNGSLDAASTVAVNPNGLLGGTGAINGPVTVTTNGSVGPGGVGVAGTLTVNNSLNLTNGALHVDLASVTTEGAGVNDLLQVNGNLTLGGLITVNPSLLNGSLANGTYRLINYTGTLDATDATLVCANAQFGATFDLATPGQINMTIANGTPLSLAWTGATDPVWDTLTTNWAAAGNPTKFTQGDAVTFDDTGSYIAPAGLFQVYQIGPLSAVDTLLPASVSVTTSNNFVLTSVGTAGRLGGGMSLYKGGTGTLTMAHGNDSLPNIYTGPTVITNGVLKVNNARALGPVTGGGVFATDGGTFDLNAQNMGRKAVTLAGAGFNGQGAVINSAGGQNNALMRVTMTGDATVGGTGRFDIRGTPADTFLSTGGQPYKLTKVGPAQFSLVNITVDSALGDVDVLGGIFGFEAGNTSFGDPAKTLTIAPNAALQLWGVSSPVNKVMVFNGGAAPSVINGSGANTIAGPITLNADSIFNVGGASLTLNGAVGGAGGLIKIGGSPLILNTANTYLGNTTVSAGTLTLGTLAWLGSSPTISVAAGATLDATAVSGGLYLASGQTLAGSGTVRGVVSAYNSTLSPGASPGTLTFNDWLILNNATAIFEVGANPITVAASDRIVTSNLLASGITTLKIVPLATLDTTTPYTLITNLGVALPSGSEANFAVTSDSRYSFSVVPTDATLGQAVQVQVSGTATASLVWQGNDATNPTWWDTKTTPNWLNGAASDTFFAGDAVVFDDSAVGTIAALVGTVQPSLISLSNTTKSITINGTGSLNTSSLTDDGATDTTIANYANNVFLNGITNNSGTLMVANVGANNFGTGLRVAGGSLTIANAGNNAVGPMTVTGGDLTIANAGLNTLGPIALTAGSMRFTQPLDTTVASVITGAGTLVKQGGYLLALNGASPAYNGPISVQDGILRAGVVGALGSIAAGTTITPGATLDVNAINLTNELVTVSGAGFGGFGAIVNNSATAQQNALHNVTLAGDTTFGGVGRWDIRNNGSGNGVLLTGGNAYNITKVGANYVTLVSVGVDAALGDIDVQQGGFGYEVVTSSLGDPTKTLNVASNAYFLIYASANPLNKKIRLQGGSLLYSQNAANTIWGPIELPNAMATIQTDVNLTLTNQISGPGSIMKAVGNTLFLSASNSLTGSFIATNGVLSISHPEALGGSGIVYIRRNVTIGGAGTKLGLTGGITTPATMTAHFTTAPAGGGDYRCSMGSDAGGTNTWGGPIQLNGGTIVGFYAGTTNPLVINGPTYGTNGFTGTAFLRGGGPVTVNGQMTMPTGKFSITDNSVVTVNSTDNVWVSAQSAYGRLVVGANNALCPTGGMILGQPGSPAFLDLNGFTQAIGSLATAGTASSQTIGSSSLTADSTLIFDGTTNLSTYAGTIMDSVAGGTMKVGLTVKSGALYLNAATSYTGPTSVEGGVLGGTGSLLSPVTVLAGGTLAPGTSIGTLTVANTVNLGGTNLMEVDKTGGFITSDQLAGVTTLTYGGTLQLALSGDPLAPGDAILLYSAAAYAGTFAAIEPATPGAGLVWDTSELATTGTLKVASPAAPALTGATLLPDGNFALTLNGTLGQPYSVRVTTDLTLGIWTVLTNGTIPVVPFVFEDLTATNYPQRFYRTSTP
jgi:autotransporter-associated beta strand protein